jgi:hypothetical protein
MDLVAELFGLIESLNAAGVEYAVCGGIALAIHGHPRFTQDIDLLVQDTDLARVQSIAAARGFSIAGGRISFGVGTPNVRELVRVSKSLGRDVLTLDLLIVGSALKGAWNSRTRAEWRGQRMWVVSQVGLLTMKRLAGRPQDLADIARLTQAGAEDQDA